jgi:hypothetical protein
MINNRYTYQDLIKAYLAARRRKNEDPDFKDFNAELYRHLSEFFNVDFDKNPDESDWICKILREMFLSAAAYYRNVSNPFSGMMEAPDEIVELYQLYGPPLKDIGDQTKVLYFDFLCDLYRRIYGETKRSITSRMLKRRGFNDARDSEEDDCF